MSTRMRKCVSAHTDPKCCVRGPPPRGAVAMRGTSPPTATCGRASQRCARRLPGMEAIPGCGNPAGLAPEGDGAEACARTRPTFSRSGQCGKGRWGGHGPAVAEPQELTIRSRGRPARLSGCTAARHAALPPAAGVPQPPGAVRRLLAGAAGRSASTCAAAGPCCALTTGP